MADYGVVLSSSRPIADHDFAQSIFQGFHKNPDANAIVEVSSANKEITYAELRRQAELFARHLLRDGVCKGDVIAIFAPNSIEWIVVFLGIIRIAGIPALINCQIKSEELKSQLSRCGAKYLYTNETLIPLAFEASRLLLIKKVIVDGRCREEYSGCVDLESFLKDEGNLPQLPSFDELHISPDDPFVILFSSGTTGAQKGVLLSHRNMEAEKLNIGDQASNIIHQCQVVFAPLTHVFGLFSIVYGFALGNISYLLARFEQSTYLKLLQDLQIEKIVVVPPIAVMLAKSPEVDRYRISLKTIVCGAAPLSEQVENQLIARFPGVSINQAYGLTETTAGSCIYPQTPEASSGVGRKPTSVGPPMANLLMKVIDMKSSKPVGPNTEGEICVKGPTVMLGYVGDRQATEAMIDKQGWLHTGDIGYYDEDGYFYIVDRLKELIKYNAFQVAPAELEAVLLSHPKVADAGVTGRPDPSAGELPMAWVVKKPNAIVTEEELEQYVSGRVAPYKRLRGGIRFVDFIPKTASGKILRRDMKKSLLHGKL